jgi:hypothetical protein
MGGVGTLWLEKGGAQLLAAALRAQLKMSCSPADQKLTFLKQFKSWLFQWQVSYRM